MAESEEIKYKIISACIPNIEKIGTFLLMQKRFRNLECGVRFIRFLEIFG